MLPASPPTALVARLPDNFLLVVLAESFALRLRSLSCVWTQELFWLTCLMIGHTQCMWVSVPDRQIHSAEHIQGP